MAFIYHDRHRVVSCVCGTLISGKHDCEIPLSQVKVEVCYWFSGRSGKPCKICVVQEKLETVPQNVNAVKRYRIVV